MLGKKAKRVNPPQYILSLLMKTASSLGNLLGF